VDVKAVYIICCLIVVNEDDKIVSDRVLKFNKTESRVFPKKKKKIQNANNI
jgi:hypothetical protein